MTLTDMSMHHTIKDSDLAAVCPYCRKDMVQEAWMSHWIGEKHYKTSMCDCGKEMWLRVAFVGSGHDDWNKKKLNQSIDDRIAGEIRPMKKNVLAD